MNFETATPRLHFPTVPENTRPWENGGWPQTLTKDARDFSTVQIDSVPCELRRGVPWNVLAIAVAEIGNGASLGLLDSLDR